MTAGLTSEEAHRRLHDLGANELPEAPRRGWVRRWTEPFASPLVWVLLAALGIEGVRWAVDGAHGVPAEAIAIAAILVLNAALAVVQEGRAERSLERLRAMSVSRVLALRDGSLVRVPSAELVPGDRIRLDAGDRVPADGVVADGAAGAVEGGFVSVDESVLTGESVPVERTLGDTLSSGTLLVRGTAWLDVTDTGPRSALGRLAGTMATLERPPTPLERRIDALGNRIAIWILGIAAALAAAGLAAFGLDRFGEVFLVAVALAVAAIPEGLPVVLTLTLALGVERMARRSAVVRRLAAVEALGSVTVAAVDKTGTLTWNRMEVRALDLGDGDEAARLGPLVLALGNEPEPGTPAADPMEQAFLDEAARRYGDELAALPLRHPRIALRPFDPATRATEVTVEDAGGPIVLIKGAPEGLLERSDLDAVARAEWAARVRDAGARGLRVIGLAWRPAVASVPLRWLGTVALWDPPREEAAASVAAARGAGVRVVMMTGDHQATAEAIAAEVGIDAEDVVARCAPERKLALIEELQASGEVVAMTGDGVNDALALKRADVGVAMGERGSDVAREASALVILDDDFSTLVAAIEEGRGIYANIRKFLRFLAATNLSELIVVVLATAVLVVEALARGAVGELVFPLTAVQILWINLVTDSAPALALALDRNPGMLHRPPRDPSEPLFGGRQLRFVLVGGAILAASALSVWAWARGQGWDPGEARTVLFLVLVGGQLLFAWPARSVDGPQEPNRALLAAVGIALGLQVLALTVPVLREALGLTPPDVRLVGPVLVGLGLAAAGGALLARMTKAIDTDSHSQ